MLAKFRGFVGIVVVRYYPVLHNSLVLSSDIMSSFQSNKTHILISPARYMEGVLGLPPH